MDLAGQESRAERGYAMAALLTMIAVMSILLSAALPVWRHEMRREREAELVFRGEQYVRAIGLYQRKFQTNPPSIDVLVQQKVLRKKYKDPITGKDFRPIYAGSLQQTPQGGGSRPGGGGFGTPQNAPQQVVGGGAAGALGGLIGVASTSEADSIRIYKGRTKYNQWQFVFAGVTGRPGGPGAGQPGGVGRPRPGRPGEGMRPGPRGPGSDDERRPGPRGPRGPGGGPGGQVPDFPQAPRGPG